MKARKSLGQNFLMHARTAARIADAAGISPEDIVLEIGPGTGKLTKPLLERAGRVIAIEADERLCGGLRETFAKEIRDGKLELIHGDIRAFDYGLLPAHYRLVANIPYYLTGEIIRACLGAKRKPASMTLLLQKEVAKRIVSDEGSLLSISIKIYGTPKYQFTVPRGAFVPAPKVDSAVVTLSDIHTPFDSLAQETRFFDVLHAGFAHKRKFLARNLENGARREDVLRVFDSLGLSPRARAEELRAAEWLTLAEKLTFK